MTTYVLGDDLYDESFSIDTGGGEFLGEYGVGVSETIGVGEPKKVAALEIWLFDKNDIKTATKVLMSEHAYNDPNIRARLEPKGELVVVKAGEQSSARNTDPATTGNHRGHGLWHGRHASEKLL